MYGKLLIMKKEPRVVKGYKIKQSVYNKAMKRAKKEFIPLATLIEDVINGYATGIEEYLFNLNKSVKK